MKVPVAPHHQHVHAVDQGLIEALSYFSEEATAPVIVNVGTPRRNKDSVAENVDLMLLSLDVQELLRSDENDQQQQQQRRIVNASGQAIAGV
ncbi:unnamed protein product [Hyaloperonospora brassicae]|uniref:Uncharacterized protein n=1 Tax=Hyaloperonospora brassicae TaxID=162125 RepID=A0AAV0SW54_HYABA|nr:unnamed protein product [Hyaloperonospora brassicae]